MAEPKLFAFMRIEKVKTWQDLAAAAKHNTRAYKGGHIIEGRPRPIELLPDDGMTITQRARAILKVNRIKPKKGQVLAVEMICTASRGFFEGASEGEIEEWLEATMRFAHKLYGPGLVSARLHIDEHTPHLHILALPLAAQIVRKTGPQPSTPKTIARRAAEDAVATPKLTLSYEALFGGPPERMADLQTDYHQHVDHLGLARGEPSDTKNVKPAEFRRQLDERERRLDNREADLDFIFQDLARRRADLERDEAQLRKDRLQQEAKERAAAQARQKAEAELTASRNELAKDLAALAEEKAELGRNREEVEATRREAAADRQAAAHERKGLEDLLSAVATGRADLSSERSELDAQIKILEKMARSARASLRAHDGSDVDKSIALTPDEEQRSKQPWPEALDLARRLIRLAGLLARGLARRLERIRTRETEVDRREREAKQREDAARTLQEDLDKHAAEIRGKEAAATVAEAQTSALRAESAQRQAEIGDAYGRLSDLADKQKAAIGTLTGAEANVSALQQREAQLTGSIEQKKLRQQALEAEIAGSDRRRAQLEGQIALLSKREAELTAKVAQQERQSTEFDAREGAISLAERGARDSEQQLAIQTVALNSLIAGTATGYFDRENLIVGRTPEGKQPMIFARQSMPESFTKAVNEAMRLHQVKAAVRIREQATERLATELQAAANEVERNRPELAPEMKKARIAAFKVQAAVQAQQGAGW